MEIKKSEFITSAVSNKQYPDDDRSEIAFVGRSNVGKSSLINTLTNRKRLARVSNDPGRTRLINFFMINELIYFVDLPGYGFAKVAKTEKAKWGKMIEEYLKTRRRLKKVVLLLDSRHVPTEDDLLMYNWLKYYNVETIIVLTKVDKLSGNQITKNIKIIKDKLNINDEKVLLFSSLKKKGKQELIDEIL